MSDSQISTRKCAPSSSFTHPAEIVIHPSNRKLTAGRSKLQGRLLMEVSPSRNFCKGCSYFIFRSDVSFFIYKYLIFRPEKVSEKKQPEYPNIQEKEPKYKKIWEKEPQYLKTWDNVLKYQNFREKEPKYLTVRKKNSKYLNIWEKEPKHRNIREKVPKAVLNFFLYTHRYLYRNVGDFFWISR